MCAMDRNSTVKTSQSLAGIIKAIRYVYDSSPVSVCVRNDSRQVLYANESFNQLYSLFKYEAERNLLTGRYLEIEYILSKIEFDCFSLGMGCVLCKNFSFGEYIFQIRMESMAVANHECCMLWQINILIPSHQTSLDLDLNLTGPSHAKLKKLLATLSEKNLIPFSYYISGFTYGDISYHLKLPPTTIKKRIEKARDLAMTNFGSYNNFILYLYQSRQITMFTDLVCETIDVAKV